VWFVFGFVEVNVPRGNYMGSRWLRPWSVLPVGAITRHVAAVVAELFLGDEGLLASIAMDRHLVGWFRKSLYAPM
jgi:hypothetical protein